MSDLSVSIDAAVMTVTIDRADQRNALTPDVVSGLLRALDGAVEQAVRVVVITGAGDRAFCAGADLGAVAAGADAGAVARHRDREQFGELVRRLREIPVPTVARINGAALAGGFGLALACDLAITVDDATFGTPEVKVGMWPYIVTAVIAEHLGPKRTFELLLSGRRLSASEALAWGLVNRVVPRDELDSAVAELIGTVLDASPVVVSLGKEAFARALSMRRDEALHYLGAMLSLHLQTDDVVEGMTAFLQKRPPEWKAR